MQPLVPVHPPPWPTTCRAGGNHPRYTEQASLRYRPASGSLSYQRRKGAALRFSTSKSTQRQLRAQHAEPLKVIWDNSPAHRGDGQRACLATPGLGLRLMNLPSYSPDCNPDAAIWGWARQEMTANMCLGTKAAVREKVGGFCSALAHRRDAVRRRCRSVLPAWAPPN